MRYYGITYPSGAIATAYEVVEGMLALLALLLLITAVSSQVAHSSGRSKTTTGGAVSGSTDATAAKKPKKKIPGVFIPPDPPNYPDLELKATSRVMDDPAFVRACKEMAGYYVDPKRNPALKNTIVISGVNSGYKDFFHNFRCHTQRLGIKFLPVALDEGIYNYLTSNKISTTYLMADIPGRDRVASEPSGFGGKNFNLIGCRKMEAVYGALSLGYDVIFSDVDIAFLSDPIGHLFIDGVDYVHSTNKGCNQRWRFNESMEGNTGFYSVRSNPRTIRTWDLTYRACSRAPLYDDQTMFWLILRTNQNPEPQPMEMCPAAGHSKGIIPRTPSEVIITLDGEHTINISYREKLTYVYIKGAKCDCVMSVR